MNLHEDVIMISRHGFLLAFVLTALGVTTGSSAEAQQIRFFVKQSTGVFEITNAAAGGRFVNAPTGERIQVPGAGTMAVQGRTDRARRGETVVTQVLGSGVAQVSVTYTPPTGSLKTIFAGSLPLPIVVPQNVSLDPNVDNVVVAVGQKGKTVSRRLPIGTRP